MTSNSSNHDQISISVVLSKARIRIESRGMKAIVALSSTSVFLGVAILWVATH